MSNPIQELQRVGLTLWAAYGEHGPGNVPEHLFDRFQRAARVARQFLEDYDERSEIAASSSVWYEQLSAAIDELGELLVQACQRPEGLNFVTGEAGLIPRRDKYERVETLLQTLERMSDLPAENDVSRNEPTVTPLGPAESIPVFNCLVYVRRDTGQVCGRVANLADIAHEDTSEALVLRQLVQTFKQRVQRYQESGDAIPWIEPPAALQEGEEQRWIAVHL